MEIINESDEDATWFCYNSDDQVRRIAMKQGDLSANGGKASYNPPNNATGVYYVLLTEKGGGLTIFPSGKIGGAYAKRDGFILLRGACAFEAVLGPQRGGGQIEIVNESDRDVTWWCFNSNDTFEEIPHKQGDLKKGGRVSYAPPSNATGAYNVLITSLGGHARYRDWAPDQSAVLARARTVRPGGSITFKGSCEYHVYGSGGGGHASTGFQFG
jgi:hypothetical protein